MAVQTGHRRYFDTVPRLMEGGGAFLEYNHSLWASHESPIWLGVYGEYARSAVNLLKGYELEQPARMVHESKGNTGDVFFRVNLAVGGELDDAVESVKQQVKAVLERWKALLTSSGLGPQD